MPIITTIYDHYQIMPNLQQHQLRVAAVAKHITDAWPESDQLNTEQIITACLLHDMGNIIKFDLARFPEFLEPKGLKYWQRVKDQFTTKYGSDEHQASLAIGTELNVEPRVLELIDAIGPRHTKANYQQRAIDKMICENADNRVAPHGVVSLEERIEDLKQRYAHRYQSEEDQRLRQEFAEYAQKIETFLFDHIPLQPSDLTEDAISDTIVSLEKWPVGQ